MKIFQQIVLSIASGLLLFAAWPMSPFTFLIFIALVPLFWLESNTANGARFFGLVLLNMFIWNVAATWWIWNASPGGAAGAIIVNSLMMCFPWMLFRFTKKKLGNLCGYASFIVYWLSWEYIYHNIELSWPWLTFGNVFGSHPSWVLWYQFTGTPGGSLWIFLGNILLYHSFNFKTSVSGIAQNSQRPTVRKPLLIITSAVLFIPLLYSFIYAQTHRVFKQSIQPNIVVVQPNVEAYTEKFNSDPAILIDRMIKLSESELDTNTRLVIWPETAIPVEIWENEIASNGYFQKVFAFVKRHPHILLVTGIDSYKNWGAENPGGFSIQTMKNGDHYEAFNTAMATDSSGNIQLYHKSKLVPGPESLPSWLGFMAPIFDALGGSSGSLGRSESPIVFTSPHNPYKAAPVICYESIYGEYVTEYIRKGANIITVITNDGWWGNTPGYKQHLSMSRLRAIETHCTVARSANTGISCFIDKFGNLYQPQPWDTAAAIKMSIAPNEEATFYVRHGDWLSRLAWPLAAILLVWAVFLARKRS